LLVGQLAALVSLAAFFYYLRHGDLLLYGDATAHINIARRVFDSRTPGPLQLGTVWLPLPHLLMLPFLLSRWMWQTAIGGSIPSLVAYVFSVVGIYTLTRLALPAQSEAAGGARFAAALSAAIMGLNPNLLFLQSTAMSEPIYLALFIAAVGFFDSALRRAEAGDRGAHRALTGCGSCLIAACLTRYDGWFLSVAIALAAVLVCTRRRTLAVRLAAPRLMVMAASAPLLWVAYNALVYANPLEFLNGPYSAIAIERKTAVAGMPPHPGAHDLRAAFQYFFKSAELNLAGGRMEIFWVLALLLGTAVVVLSERKLWPLLLLWVPVPFYMLSIAYGGIPLFVPVWWPFSHYNVRYGIELLPGFAAFTAVAAYKCMQLAARMRTRLAVGAGFSVLVLASYLGLWRTAIVSYEEAAVNSRTRIALETRLASELRSLPPGATFLMYLGDHVGAFERAGIPLARVIYEGNHRPWKRPSDPEGLWERALRHPSAYAEYVIAFDSDPVAAAVNRMELAALAVLHVSGQPEATIYRTRKAGNQPR
jgi:hypothetical protein